jgi:nucleoside-diphosphate-sugar epimerase
MSDTVLLYGATSYVGQYLLRSLLDSGTRVTAVINNPISSTILLGDHIGRVELATQEQAMRQSDVRAVINLAYVRTASPHRANRENERLMRSVHEAAVRTGCARVIHASTIAVFGYEPTEPPRPVAVPVRPGNFYIETKTRAEHLLVRAAEEGRYHLSIVRLGNVVGPGSAAWTASLAQRLLEARPMLKTPGYSNATYVENIGSYIAHLSATDKAGLDRFGTYHHLTEFARHSWDEFLTAIEATVGLKRVAVDSVRSPSGARFSHSIGAALKQAYRGRLGGYARNVLGRLPWQEQLDAAFSQVKELDAPEAHLHGPGLASEDLAVLGLLAGRVLIEPVTLPGWTPPVAFPIALERIAAWLDASGYAVRSAG